MIQCRLCLSKNAEAFEIFGQKGIVLDVASILSKHFWFEVTQEDTFSPYICTECWDRVESFHELYLSVERKYKNVSDDLYGLDQTVEYVNIKEESDVHAEADVEFRNDNSVEVLVKSDTQHLEVDVNDDTIIDDTLFSNDIEHDVDASDGDDFVPSASDSDSDYDIPLDKYAKSIKPTRKRERKKPSSEPAKVKIIKREAKPRFDSTKDNDTIQKYFTMTCDICGHPFKTFLHAKRHHAVHHDQTGYVTCCEKKFYKLYRVMQHCIWHENPEAFKCTECAKCFLDGVGLRDHMDNVHAPADKRIFACDVCPKTFLRRHMLTTHKRMQHITDEDKKFACSVCGQKFVIQAFLQAHIKKVHENADSRICDICAKFFKCSKSYEIHYMCVHSDVQHKVQCELCGKWLKHKDSLKEHKRRHIATNEKCEFCGRISSNKKALRAHIRSAHTAPAYPCTICNKLFKKTQTLREHMAIHAGRTDLYSCTFCTKTFRSSANMYAHRKKAHPKEYEENKVCGSKYTRPPDMKTDENDDVLPFHSQATSL